MSQGIEASRGQPPAKSFIRNPQDFWGGIAIVVLALFAFYASSDLPGLQGFAFGPGTAPRLFAGLLLTFGVVIVAIGVLTDGPAIGGYAVRGPFWITASLIVFAILIRPVGLVIATYVTFMISAVASRETRWLESAITGVCMTAFCVVLFIYLLNLPFQLWPRF